MRVIKERPPGIAEAMSLTNGAQDLIWVDPELSARRMRFTLGHELGHLLMHDGVSRCGANVIGGAPKDIAEAEANTFSAHLLLPTELFRNDAGPCGFCKTDISRLAESYNVSFSSTALRFLEVTGDECALVTISEGDWSWFQKSKKTGWWLKVPSDEGTLAAEIVERGTCSDQSRETEAIAWLNGDVPPNGCLREEAIQIGARQWLVLLSELPDSSDDPDIEEREAIEDLNRRRLSFRRY